MAFINSLAALSSVKINKWISNSGGQDKRKVDRPQPLIGWSCGSCDLFSEHEMLNVKGSNASEIMPSDLPYYLGRACG